MIGMAQSLEQVQRDSDSLKTLFQYTFSPIVNESIVHLEDMLLIVEASFNKLASKTSTKIQAKTNDLSKKFHNAKNLFKAGAIDRINSMDNSSDDGTDSLLTSSFDRRQNISKSVYTPPAIDKKQNLKQPAAGIPIMQGSVDQANKLKIELERILAGITLLDQGVERLGEMVDEDTKSNCCSLGLFSMFTSSSSNPSIKIGTGLQSYNKLDNGSDKSVFSIDNIGDENM
jgi:hypothetical protein